jgi:hypothetical protein
MRSERARPDLLDGRAAVTGVGPPRVHLQRLDVTLDFESGTVELRDITSALSEGAATFPMTDFLDAVDCARANRLDSANESPSQNVIELGPANE